MPEPVPHLTREACEQYALEQLTESEVLIVEEHLLLCEYCRQRLDQTEQEINILRETLQQADWEEQKRRIGRRSTGSLLVLTKSTLPS